MRDSPGLQLLLRAVGCCLLTWLCWRALGLIPALSTLVVWGYAVARPLLEIAVESVRRIQAHAWRDIEGRHHSIAGHPVRVIEEGAHGWLRLRDLRRALQLPALPQGDETQADHVAPFRGRWRAVGSRNEVYVRADTAVEWMAAHSSGADPRWSAVRIRIERDIVHPAARRAGRDTASPLSRHTAPPRPATPAPPTVRDEPTPSAHQGQSPDGHQETQGPGPRT